MATEYNDYIEKRRLRKRRYMILGAILAVVVIVIVIVVPVVVTKQKKNNAIQLDTGGSASSDNTTYPINTGSGQYPVSNYAHLITPIATQNDLKERIFVIGDVHGCATEFNALLDAVHFNASTDQVILAGDLTSKGPDSIGVIRRAKEIGALCVRGNHDDKIVRLKTFELKRGLGAMTPLDATMPEGNVPDPLKFKNYHMEIVKNMTRDDYDYLSSCPVILHLPTFNNSVIVHGGIDPTIQNLYDQIPYLVMNMRNIDKHDNPTPDHTVGQQWAASFNDVQKELTVNNTNVYYGHNADRGLNLRDYTFGLDTGCVYGKELTAMDIRTHQLTQVKCKKYAS